jgi:putative membrane protein
MLPVVSAIVHAANVVDCLIWSVIALIVQVAV